ncbi:MAG: hypothetical protein JOZ33_09510 [Acidobacteriaceae bacterium]|nr:hypothetical protein [Acidobacteriaceae bacterium]
MKPVRLRSSVAILLTAMLFAVSWSSSLCETVCVLPHETHACCAAQSNPTHHSVARIQGCTHSPRLIAAQPILQTSVLSPTPQAVAVAPDVTSISSQSSTAPRTSSPPQFHLRI